MSKDSAPDVLEFTDDDFESDVLGSDKPVLVDFWAEWCGPCRAMGPVINDLATKLSGSVKVGKMNVDDNPATPMKYGITSIPTVLIFKGGEVVKTMVGAQPTKNFEDALAAVS